MIIERLQDTRLFDKSITFLHTSIEQVEFIIKNLISFTSAPPPNEISINLTKYIQDLCKENYKNLINKIKELNKWNVIPCS